MTNVGQSNNYTDGAKNMDLESQQADRFGNREEMARGFRNTRMNPILQESETSLAPERFREMDFSKA